ncbi:MAG: Adenylate cyclase [Bacteroidetes bacterium]|nr:MAG: Adenylate cyclase [Bacteroidota bacterium]
MSNVNTASRFSVVMFSVFAALILFSSCSQNNTPDNKPEAGTDSILMPRIILLAGLPDSSAPRVILTDTMPEPVNIPIGKNSSYTVSTTSGQKKIDITPPQVHSLMDSVLHLPLAPEVHGSAFLTNYNSDNGLALDALPSALLDQSGNLWFGTYGGGVSRYDGKSFTTFTTSNGLVNNTVVSIAQERSGIIWFGTSGGLSRYDGKSFTSFTKKQGLADNMVLSMLQDKSGNMWFATGKGVSRYDGKSFTNYTTEQGLAYAVAYCIKEDKAGNIWIGTYGGGVSRFDGKHFKNYTSNDGLANNIIFSIHQDRSGKIWFGSYGNGVSLFDGKSFTNFTTRDGLAGNEVYQMIEDKEGNLWLATNGGVSRRNKDAGTFTNFTGKQGLPMNHVLTVTEDRSGNLWFGTYGSGISCYNGRSFTTISSNNGLVNNQVLSINEDESGNIWFGTFHGLSRYDGKSFTNFTVGQGLANNSVLCVHEDKKGKFWIGTYGGGVSCYDGNSFTNISVPQGLPFTVVYSILEDKSGNFWFGTGGYGVARYDGKTFTHFTTRQGLPNNTVRCMREDKQGNIWFGTEGGVCRYDGKSFLTLSTDQGLVNNTVYNIIEDSGGNFWIGTSGGLSELTKKQLDEINAIKTEAAGTKNAVRTEPFFENFTTKDGLPDNNVTQILPVGENKLYLGTNLGVCELLYDSKANAGEKNWMAGRIFNSVNGYPVKDVNFGLNGLFRDRHGIIWIATGSDKTALVRFDPAALNESPKPVLVINKIKINNEDVCWNDLLPAPAGMDSTRTAETTAELVGTFGKQLSAAEREAMKKKFKGIGMDGVAPWYPVPQNLVLPYKNNNISFDFNAVETGRNFAVMYQYMLEGYDRDWSPPSARATASFGNIYEGAYTFKLRAKNPDGVWGEPLNYSFTVLPPWWRTWWMYTLDLLLVISLIGGYIKWRERKLKKEKMALQEKVNIATKEIREEKEKSDNLLLNILPSEVAEELKEKGSAEARLINEVTVLFTDFKGFTQLSEKLSPKELVAEIHECFSAFDVIMKKHGIEKIKTIGDAYMAAGGLPVPNKTHAADVISAALEIQAYMEKHRAEKEAAGQLFFEIRIGIHSGPVVAGIVGVKKFAYDIWGDTVNIASRMESSGEPGKINISGSTCELVKGAFHLTYRGKIEAKNKGRIDMYFVDGKIKN